MWADFNWLGVIVAAVAAMVIGGLWYSPLMFAKPWMNGFGKRREDMDDPKPAMFNALVMNALSAFALEIVFAGLQVSTLAQALASAIVLATGLVVTNQLMRDRFHSIPGVVSLINGGNTIVTYLVMGAILILVN